MDWEEFLYENQYSLDEDEYNELDEEDIVFMEYAIEDLKKLLEVTGETSEDFIHIEQEEPGGTFEIWTKYRIYFSTYDDDLDGGQRVMWAFRHPPYAVVR